ncbi:flagellar protein FlaG [Desulfoscipio geothermicus]|uniref:Flagellar protein FlaG n=1 Tax=Desulfoscipio geothermicus DSM 3669 TaxID=1121426 RepID=A0A1I6CV55_9FIRM|nr:flagellar protein FlaG [Desulfoscipio geothermicus]SFQ96993.1 flagellar protein FlaG [Desulfoscipio geothermicus DSM 3669]
MKIAGIDPGAVADLNKHRPPAVAEKQHDGGVAAKQTIADTDEQRQGQQYSRKELEQAVNKLNNTMESYVTELRFELHEKSGEIMVKVINEKDNTVIREIPPEKVLDMVAYFKKLLGIIVDKMI